LGIAVGVGGELVYPKTFYNRVFNIFYHFFPERFVYQHAVHIKECRTLILQKCEQGVGENVLHARAPRIHPDLTKRREKPGHHQVTLVVAHVLHHVKGDRVVHVERCKVHYVFNAVFGHILHDPIRR